MKFVYLINEYKGKNMNELFGEKGTYILEIANLGLPVMNGLIVTTDACTQFYKEAEKINYNILEQVNKYINKLEQSTNKKFGNIDNPLLLSIKCSPKSNIPNIMDSVLNVGLTYDMVENLSKNTDEYIWIWECYLNFIKNYSKIIMGIDLECYEYVKEILNNNSQLTIEQLRVLFIKLKQEYKLKTQTDFPDNSTKQLYSIINIAFKSWNNDRAISYRKLNDISFEDGMAICIQPMVFGNINKNCGTGTIFTRDPISGNSIDEFTNKKYFLGNFSKQSIENTINENKDFINENSIFAKEYPDIYIQLKNISKVLERHYKNMLKIDFEVENNKLFITEVCVGKRTAKASLKIACDISEEYNLSQKIYQFQVKDTPVNYDFEFDDFKQKAIKPLDNVVEKLENINDFNSFKIIKKAERLLNINTFDNYSLKDIKQLKNNLKRNKKNLFYFKENSNNATLAKKLVKK